MKGLDGLLNECHVTRLVSYCQVVLFTLCLFELKVDSN